MGSKFDRVCGTSRPSIGCDGNLAPGLPVLEVGNRCILLSNDCSDCLSTRRLKNKSCEYAITRVD
jgi:hypothetical protein